MKLYFSPGACSLSPHIVAQEAGLPLELVKVNLKDKTLPDGSDFRAVNPKGYVPSLEISPGVVLTEGPAIVQYLADLKPESALAPKNGTFERARLQETLNFISTELHKGFSPLFNPLVSGTPEWRAIIVERLNLRFSALEEMLKGRDFLMGDHFTVADAYLITVLGWAPVAKVDLSGFPTIQAYAARIANRPSVRAAMVAEGLKKA